MPSRRDSTSSWVTLVSGAVERASARTMTSGTKRIVDSEQAAAGEPLGSSFEERGHCGEHEDDARSPITMVRGEKTSFSGSGGGSKVKPLSSSVRFGRDVADEEHTDEPEQHPEGLSASEAQGGHVVDPHPVLICVDARPPAPSRLQPEDPPHDHVRGHEQQHEGLHDAHGVDRQAGLLLHQPGAGQHRAPQDRREDDGVGVGPGQQRDGDGVEADRREHARAEEARGATDLAGAGQAGERAGDGHHHDDRAVHAHARRTWPRWGWCRRCGPRSRRSCA